MVMKTTIANDSRLLKEISGKIIDILKGKGVEEGIIFDIHVGLEEALRNAMMHGNKWDPDKKVTVETEIAGAAAIICVEDEGNGFDPKILPDPTLDENLLKESGRGVYLIRHLMDEVRYENGGRRIIMTKYLDKKHF
ncbi:MAG: ATP-binding protein [Candidatus Makaraimicrobium thalassicum]|nr:MAG: ATP-binding protein [Candidatus Omnitrophota bacterium]